MSIKHTLGLDIPDTACDNILKIVDSSAYGQGMTPTCLRLDVTVPGFTNPAYITEDLTPGFTVNLTAIDLGLQPTSNTVLATLPDGLYTVKYSVSPNDKVYIEYYHLRMTSLLTKYFSEICKIQLATCEPTAEQKQKMDDLRYIRMLMDAAKAKAEYCHATTQAVDMYNYACKLLAKYQTGCCLTCRK
jgi:hypothetical protein